jgi:hypothetical protein
MSGPDPLTFTSGGRRLAGVLELPTGPLQGGVVFVHGWSGCRVGPHRILVEAARHLNALGLATLRFDLSGRGESEGEPLATDLDRMVDDASAALAALGTRLGQALPLGMLGMCSGGNVALGAAALRDDVGAVVCWSTYAFQEQNPEGEQGRRARHFAAVYLRKALRPATWLKLLRGRVDFGGVRRTLFGGSGRGERSDRDRQRSRRDLVGALAGYRGRLRFLYGGKDPEAGPAEETFRAFCAEHDIRAEFACIEGANHNFYSLAWKRQAIEWTGRRLAEALAR